MLGAALGPAAPACQRAQPGTPRHRPELTAEKESLHADARETARVQQARAADRAEITALDAARFKGIAASGVNLALTRLSGRAPRGERGVGTVPPHDGAKVTRLAALGSHGVEAVMTIDGATEAEVCRASVDQGLGPTLRPGDTVSMDHLRAPKATGIREAIAQAGARRQYGPPSSPDWSPIAPWWSQLKTAVRAAQARTREALEHAVAQALATITVAEAHSWFRHCGYALQ